MPVMLAVILVVGLVLKVLERVIGRGANFAIDIAPSSLVPRCPTTRTAVRWKEYCSKYVRIRGPEYFDNSFTSWPQVVSSSWGAFNAASRPTAAPPSPRVLYLDTLACLSESKGVVSAICEDPVAMIRG